MSVPSLSASLKEKQKRDYNVQLDIEVRNWVSVFLGEKIDLSPATSFGTIFKDGVLLCQIINKIQPGLIPEPARSPLAFKQMENIQNYLNGCRQLGLPQSSLFNTIDLFEEKNLNLVVSNVFNICHLARGTRFSSDRDSATSIAAHKQKQKPGVASLSSSASVHQDNRRKGSLVGSALTSSASTIENKSKLTVPPRVTPPRAASTPLHRDPARDAPPPGPTPTPPKKKELLLDHDFRALLISMAKSVLHMIENIRRSKRNFLEYLDRQRSVSCVSLYNRRWTVFVPISILK